MLCFGNFSSGHEAFRSNEPYISSVFGLVPARSEPEEGLFLPAGDGGARSERRSFNASVDQAGCRPERRAEVPVQRGRSGRMFVGVIGSPSRT